MRDLSLWIRQWTNFFVSPWVMCSMGLVLLGWTKITKGPKAQLYLSGPIDAGEAGFQQHPWLEEQMCERRASFLCPSSPPADEQQPWLQKKMHPWTWVSRILRKPTISLTSPPSGIFVRVATLLVLRQKLSSASVAEVSDVFLLCFV